MQYLKTGKIIGENIRRVRKERQLTQEELAAQLQIGGLDMSRSTVAKIESGIRHITLDELKVIKDTLKMDYDDFFKEL